RPFRSMIAAVLHVRSLNRRFWSSSSSFPSWINVIHMSTPCSPMLSWTNLSFLRRYSILRGELSSFTLLLSLVLGLSFCLISEANFGSTNTRLYDEDRSIGHGTNCSD